MDSYNKTALANIIYHNSFGRANVTLASGRTSNFYFDMKPTMFVPEGAHFIAKFVHQEVEKIGAQFIGGLEMGAVPIVGAVCQYSYLTKHPIKGFFVRKKPKDHGAKKLIEGLVKGKSLAGKQVVVVEDVTTTGASAIQAIRACQEDGALVALVISIVDREEGAAQTFADLGIPFKSLYVASTFLQRTDD